MGPRQNSRGTGTRACATLLLLWPRFHHQWMTVKPVTAQGEVAAIGFDNGWLEGAPDPRTEGTAEGY